MKVKRANIYRPIYDKDYWKIYISTIKPQKTYIIIFDEGKWYLNDYISASTDNHTDFDSFAKQKRLPHIIRKVVKQKIAGEIL